MTGAAPTALVLTRPVVRLVDLADLSAVPAPLRDRAERIEVVRITQAAMPQMLPRAFLTRRIRAQLPLLAGWADRHLAAAYVVSYRRPDAADDGQCLRALSDIAEGDVLRAEKFVVSDCTQRVGAQAFYRYVPSERAVRARRAIGAGTVAPRFAGFESTLAYAGDELTLLASSGPVAVTRQIRLLQSARPGERVFVRTADGEVLSAPFQGAGR